MQQVTVTMTLAELQALEWIAAYGVDEKREFLDSKYNDYTAAETAEQRRDLETANDAIGALQGALRAVHLAKSR